jgi:hypothetical protein
MTKLIGHFLNAPSVGLSEKEKLVLMALYGIGPKGETHEPKSSKELADALGVSVVRVSQLRTGAIAKIQEYVQARNFGSEDIAAQKLGLEESKLLAIAKSLLHIIRESINIEIEMYSAHQIVEMKSNYRGLNESIKIHVNSDTFEVDNALNEENESILGNIEKSLIDEASSIAKAKSSPKYFVEMMNNVIGMQAQPVLATINNSISRPVSNEEILDSVFNYLVKNKKMTNARAKRTIESMGPEEIGVFYDEHCRGAANPC